MIKIKHPYPLWIMAVLLLFFGLVKYAFLSLGIYVNRTDSEPHGLYRQVSMQSTRDISRGDLVCLAVPENMQPYVYGRHWAQAGTPLLKAVGGLPGDVYEAKDSKFFINGQYVGPVSNVDMEGLPLPQAPTGSHVVQAGYFLAISTYSEDSFDSRYMGEIPLSNIVAKVKPFWLW